MFTVRIVRNATDGFSHFEMTCERCGLELGLWSNDENS